MFCHSDLIFVLIKKFDQNPTKKGYNNKIFNFLK